MQLVFLSANNAWVLLFGDQIIRLYGFPMFFCSRKLALEAARSLGITEL